MKGLDEMRTAACAALIVLCCGCNPRVTVTKSPGPHNTGIRYYRPKPYLLITPHGSDEAADVSEKFVKLQLQYLPDFSEEYSIKVRTGLGTNKTTIKLENGWNLTEINQELDSKFADNVNAIANLISKLPIDGGPQGARREGENGGAVAVVPASNVPIGYYEAVIGDGPNHSKHLYGWRYVGFMPFNACPLNPGGLDAPCCNDGSLEIYGLVFRGGAMRFEPLFRIREEGSDCPVLEEINPEAPSVRSHDVARSRAAKTPRSR